MAPGRSDLGIGADKATSTSRSISWTGIAPISIPLAPFHVPPFRLPAQTTKVLLASA